MPLFCQNGSFAGATDGLGQLFFADFYGSPASASPALFMLLINTDFALSRRMLIFAMPRSQ